MSNQPVIVGTDGGVIGLTEKQNLKKLNNEEFIAHLMTVSPYGAMCQIFIIEAIRYYSERVSSQDIPADDPDALINPKAWHATAEDISRQMALKYE